MNKLKNNLPKGWRKVRLGDWIELKYGFGLSEKERIKGDVPVFGSSGILGWHNKPAVKKEGIIIGRKGNVGAVYFSEKPFYPIDTVYFIDSLKKTGDLKFFYYLLKTINFQKVDINVGVPGLNRDTAHDLEILIPENLDEQKRIADILSAFDDKIELNNKINKTLEEMAQAIFKEWFVNFRFPGYEKVKLIDSELGKIPEGWKVKMLPEVFDFLEGPGIRNWQYTRKGCPFINIRLIQNNDINVKLANFISEKEANEKYKHFHLKERDMVVSTSGTLGRSAIVRKEHLPLLLNTSVIRFRPKDNKSYAFMYQFLKSDYFQNKILTMASGSAQPNFGPTHLKQIKILVPEKDILDKFNELVNPIYEIIIGNMSENQTLAALRDLLLPKLMSGEIRV